MPGSMRPLFAVVLLGTACGCAAAGGPRSPLTWMRKPATAADGGEKSADVKPADVKTADAKPKESKPADPAPAAKSDPATTEVAKPDAPKPDVPKSDVPKSDATQVAAAEPAPFKPAPDAAPPADAKPAESPAEAPPAGLTRSGTTVHDAETLAMIDEELRSAPPEQRDALYEEWKSLDSAWVRQMIRIRRMVREKELFAGGPAPPASVTAGRIGTADPWGGAGQPAAATAAYGATPDARTLALGAIEPLDPAPLTPAANSTPAGPTSAGHALTAGHSVPGEAPQPYGGVVPTAGVQANGPPAAPPAVLGPTPPADPAWDAQLRQLISLAETRAERARAAYLDRPAGAPAVGADDEARRRYVESQVHLRMLYLTAGEQARAMQAIPGLNAADQEFWQQVFWGLSNYFDDGTLPNRSDRVSQTVAQMREAVARLQTEANLELKNVAFCHKITSFGNYERFDRDEYSPGQRVLLYAEVVNFKSVPQPSDGLYRTQLKSTIEIFRAGVGQPVSRIEFEETADLCRAYRQDYFHSYEMKIPGDLPLGPHVMKLTIEDIQSGKVASYGVNFTVK